jgi:hypothetical protein
MEVARKLVKAFVNCLGTPPIPLHPCTGGVVESKTGHIRPLLRLAAAKQRVTISESDPVVVNGNCRARQAGAVKNQMFRNGGDFEVKMSELIFRS